MNILVISINNDEEVNDHVLEDIGLYIGTKITEVFKVESTINTFNNKEISKLLVKNTITISNKEIEETNKKIKTFIEELSERANITFGTSTQNICVGVIANMITSDEDFECFMRDNLNTINDMRRTNHSIWREYSSLFYIIERLFS